MTPSEERMTSSQEGVWVHVFGVRDAASFDVDSISLGVAHTGGDRSHPLCGIGKSGGCG